MKLEVGMLVRIKYHKPGDPDNAYNGHIGKILSACDRFACSWDVDGATRSLNIGRQAISWNQMHLEPINPENQSWGDFEDMTKGLKWEWRYETEVAEGRGDGMSEWISVKDRLPEFDIPVLGYCRIYGRGVRVYTRIADTEYGQWDDITGFAGGLPPTHWVPLPEPPESP